VTEQLAPLDPLTAAYQLASTSNLAIDVQRPPGAAFTCFKVYRKVGGRRSYLGKRRTPAELLAFVRLLARVE
jgi:hypothetical protein